MMTAPEPAVTNSSNHRWRLDWVTVAWILALKALVLGFAVLSVRTLSDNRIDFADMWNRWDAVHYRLLALTGYQASGEERFSIVFFPLYPWLVRLTRLLLRDYTASALVVSGVASVAAGLLLQQLTRLDKPARTARAAVWFLFIFPTSLFPAHRLHGEFVSGAGARLHPGGAAGALGAGGPARRLRCVDAHEWHAAGTGAGGGSMAAVSRDAAASTGGGFGLASSPLASRFTWG